MAVTIVVGSSSSIGSMGAAAAVEREWVKVLCGADTLMLARMNSGEQGGRGRRLETVNVLPCPMHVLDCVHALRHVRAWMLMNVSQCSVGLKYSCWPGRIQVRRVAGEEAGSCTCVCRPG